MFGNDEQSFVLDPGSQFSSCSTVLAVQRSQKAGAADYITILAIPLDTIDRSGFSHHVGSRSLPATTSQGPVAASTPSALLAAHPRTKETQA